MRKFVVFGALLLLAGCTSLNPFASSRTKIPALQPIKATAEARQVWRQNVGKADIYAFTPAAVGETVYAAGRDGTIIRVDDNRVAWKIDARQPLSGGVGADRDLVVVGTPKGDVLAFSAVDGKPVWTAEASGEVLSPPALGEGLVFVRSGDNRIAAYDPADGKRKWMYQRPTPSLALRATSRLLVENRTVFVGFPGGKLVALNAANGVAVWDGTVALPKGTSELDRVADVSSEPVIAGRTICAVAFQGRVACFDLGSGNQVWSREMSSAVGLAVDNRYVYVTDDKGAIHCLDIASGASLWKQDKLVGRRPGAPLAWRGRVVVADVEGVVHFLSRDDGAFIARANTDGSPVVAPLLAVGGQVVVQTSGGGVFAIEVQ